MQMQRGFADVNGTRLSYEIAGAGEPIVFIHGFSLDHRMWDDQFSALAAHHRVLRYDLRGFGASSVPDGPYRHVDDLAALMDHAGIARATIVGLSLGGGFAVDFALTYPEKVAALVPVDSILGGHRMSGEWDASVTPIWRAGRAGDIATSKRLWLAHELFAPARSDPGVGARLDQMVQDYSGWHWRYHDSAQEIAPAAAEQLDRVSAPALVIVGERDLPDLLVIADRLAREIPGARKVSLPHAGHMANMEAPQQFNETLLAFCASH
jgi:pimeloyl-ACP methyl ester carboxylesterase